ncbi:MULTISPECIES: ThiF family adenylyltransferase [unclassified Paraburkholderia]|uniref:ThiF family adenylyltransferase n=1 Tax=unclassified Paraburkholderia TaxID=2615204 RepID=UPI002AAF6AA0|nr:MULTISPECIES: ThiF family adenylyltransferase [unclassified Paraburkholderia]
MALSVLANARSAAMRFLDGAHANHAVRLDGPAPDGSADVWRLTAEVKVGGVSEILFALPEGFPAIAPNVFIVGDARRGLPHIEVKGRVCLDVETFGTDYDRPEDLIRRTLAALEDYLRLCEDRDWVKKEFAKEAELYWNNYCDVEASKVKHVDVPRGVVLLDEVCAVNEGELRIQTSSSHLGKWAHVAVGDPGERLRKQAIRADKVGRAKLLIVRLGTEEAWGPGVWPKTYASLAEFVRAHRPDAAAFVAQKVRRGSMERGRLTERFVLVVTAVGNYAYQIRDAAMPLLELPTLLPLPVMRMDTRWCLTRDEGATTFQKRQDKKVVVFGAGSLAAPTIDLLARAGIGHIEVVDFDRFEPENISRHPLGLGSVGMNKAKAIARQLTRDVPGINAVGSGMRAERWLAEQTTFDGIDLFVDLTGTSSVRTLLSRLAKAGDLVAPVMLAWLEPYGSAAHVVTLVNGDRWPDNDPVERLALAEWPPETEVRLPGCGAGFHPYGAADALRAAALTAEKILDVIDGKVWRSGVSSFKRDLRYLDDLPVVARALNPVVPYSNQGGKYLDVDLYAALS